MNMSEYIPRKDAIEDGKCYLIRIIPPSVYNQQGSTRQMECHYSIIKSVGNGVYHQIKLSSIPGRKYSIKLSVDGLILTQEELDKKLSDRWCEVIEAKEEDFWILHESLKTTEEIIKENYIKYLPYSEDNRG